MNFIKKKKEWSDGNGVRRDIRTLISTLQNILWEGANWNVVSFYDLQSDANLKVINYFDKILHKITRNI